ncbi:Sec-independent protein translocase protein TatB [Iodidimonas sp. SYSU 1G8]|uniref:Sec-independent protein translocase protein TatB n=1 Tax=Iodidimonas sp. SYSU 1G8 TaxID=3133967 RepID=UPI0031FEC1C9
MFDVGLPELLVIVLVALVVVGPKDLPKVVRGIARAIAKMRRMADEFMGTVNDYVRESELQELREAVEKTKRAMNGQGDFDDLLDPTGPAKKSRPDDPEKLADAQLAGEGAVPANTIHAPALADPAPPTELPAAEPAPVSVPAKSDDRGTS